jgi:hypothetical protein
MADYPRIVICRGKSAETSVSEAQDIWAGRRPALDNTQLVSGWMAYLQEKEGCEPAGEDILEFQEGKFSPDQQYELSATFDCPVIVEGA